MANLQVVSSVLKANDAEAWELLRAATRVPKRRPGGLPEAKEACERGRRSPRAAYAEEAQLPEGGPLPRPVLRHPLDRVWELEHQVSLGLATILEEERKNVERLKAYVAASPARDFVAAGRAACEAELELSRLAEGPGSCDDERLHEMQEELFRLTSAVPALMTLPAVPSMLAPSQCLEEHVSVLLQACREHIAQYDRHGAASEELATAHALGQLLLEVDRDILRMSHALIHVSDDRMLGAAADRLSMAANTRPPAPAADSLAHQLELENELLKDITHPMRHPGSYSRAPDGHPSGTGFSQMGALIAGELE